MYTAHESNQGYILSKLTDVLLMRQTAGGEGGGGGWDLEKSKMLQQRSPSLTTQQEAGTDSEGSTPLRGMGMGNLKPPHAEWEWGI